MKQGRKLRDKPTNQWAPYLWQRSKNIQWRKDSLFNKWCWETWPPYWPRWEVSACMGLHWRVTNQWPLPRPSMCLLWQRAPLAAGLGWSWWWQSSWASRCWSASGAGVHGASGSPCSWSRRTWGWWAWTAWNSTRARPCPSSLSGAWPRAAPCWMPVPMHWGEETTSSPACWLCTRPGPSKAERSYSWMRQAWQARCWTLPRRPSSWRWSPSTGSQPASSVSKTPSPSSPTSTCRPLPQLQVSVGDAGQPLCTPWSPTRSPSLVSTLAATTTASPSGAGHRDDVCPEHGGGQGQVPTVPYEQLVLYP